MRALLIAVVVMCLGLAACDSTDVPPGPDAGVVVDADVTPDALPHADATIEIECRRWCGERHDCTGQPTLECLNACIDQPWVVHEDPCPGGTP